mmetsp:Transcript_5655/g.5167  ORF Transcript_5655/g.5167 Transcript_5655/m.5167 type:complete len:116 (+) Transcript_5655:2776-3123(+)|eukprot:CAMPEP_0170540800 /NCGR_PEP_ID=MMETSP0211-20121228/731_1 /TAXON_ID=311385 /ORGANISM="Pseudokeronopsis sp., Strain OXSARD2" /LENGTH=115 /DNA_ID=CAMNT_0010843333 /DNA_START=2699 /DNA_END=3046 /DNA_ORIENTATION=-
MKNIIGAFDEESKELVEVEDGFKQKAYETTHIREKFEQEKQMKTAKNYMRELQKLQILNESETYYQRNMTAFNNNMSLLALNTYEISQLLGILNNENRQIMSIAKNITTHTSFIQ